MGEILLWIETTNTHVDGKTYEFSAFTLVHLLPKSKIALGVGSKVDLLTEKNTLCLMKTLDTKQFVHRLINVTYTLYI